MPHRLHWLGHSAFRFEGKKRIYFDPFRLPKDSAQADIILISHEHFDHYSPDDIKLISSKNTVIVTDISTGKQLRNAKLICKEVKSLSPEEAIKVSGVRICAVSSYNTNKHFHLRGSKKLGFIVSVEDLRIYHAGDTDLTPEMKDYECDIALLPVSGIYVMTAEEAAEAALTIKPKLAIPMHYGSIIGSDNDARRFQDLLKGKVEVKILKKES